MKILVPGKSNKSAAKRPWYWDTHNACKGCGCIFKIEEDDIVELMPKIPGYEGIHVTCPGCSKRLRISRQEPGTTPPPLSESIFGDFSGLIENLFGTRKS